jgi:hypothetical protein
MTSVVATAESTEAKRERLLEILRQKARATKFYPLSFPQQRLWFLAELEPQSASYNCPGAIRLKGRLNVAALRASLNEVVRRHEVLRTTFNIVEGEPVQTVSPRCEVSLPIVDLSAAPDAEELTYPVAEEQSRRPFDLMRGPLLRAFLLRLSDDHHLILLIIHHITGDAWSFGILIREVTTLYDAHVQGRKSPLPELRLQYKDFAQWQREWLKHQTFVEHVDYWRRQLENLPPIVLSTRQRKSGGEVRHGERHWLQFAPDLSHTLKSLASGSGATMFMTVLAGFQALLYRYTGQHEFPIGSPIANRKHVETERLVGFFVNMLVLRADLSGNPTFRELLSRVRETCLDAYAHQDVPFEKIVEELAPQRSGGSTPWLDVVFGLASPPREMINLKGLTTGRVALRHGYARFDLTVSLVDMPDGLEVTAEFDRDLFTLAEIDLLVQRFEGLLTRASNNPDLRLLQIPLSLAPANNRIPVQLDQFDFDSIT